jgi:hypothetical protein
MERYKSEIRVNNYQFNFRVLSNWLRFICSEAGNFSRTRSECLAQRVQERVRNAFRTRSRSGTRSERVFH